MECEDGTAQAVPCTALLSLGAGGGTDLGGLPESPLHFCSLWHLREIFK